MKKDTGDLRQELMAAPELERFLQENEGSFRSTGLSDEVEAMRIRHGLSKAAFAQNAGISTVYLYQILSGMRRPTRDKLICLAFSAGADEAEARTLLKQGGYAELYAADRRDAILLYGFVHGMTLFEINDALYRAHEETLV